MLSDGLHSALHASRVLTDAAVGDVEEISTAARSVAGVVECHQVRAPGVGGMVRVDLHVTVDPQITVARSHDIAEEVERRHGPTFTAAGPSPGRPRTSRPWS